MIRRPSGLARGVAAASALMLALAIAPATSAESVASTNDWVEVTVRVLAPTKPCSKRTLSGAAAVPGARVSANAVGSPLRQGMTDADGGVTLKVPVHRDTRVTVTFDSPTLEIHPGDGGMPPYQWTSPPFRASLIGGEFTVTMKDPIPAGLATLWRTAQMGRLFASQATVKRLPKLHLAWEANASLNDRTYELPTAFDGTEKVIDVGGEGTLEQRADPHRAVVRHEWEPLAVVHEIGHWFMDVNADPGPNLTDSSHALSKIYPNDHVLAYGEGFANAFASLALGKTRLDIDCERFLDFTEGPPSYLPYPSVKPMTDLQLSQYNEVWVGQVIRRVALWLAAKDPSSPGDVETADAVDGLKALTKALIWYDDAGLTGPPSRVRELADAVIRSGAYRKGATKDVDITTNLAELIGLFGDGFMGLGIRITADYDGFRPPIPSSSPGGQSGYRVELQIRGPGQARCAYSLSSPYVSVPGSGLEESPDRLEAGYARGAISALDGSWIDDCIATHNTAVIGYLNSGSGILTPANSERWSAWARYACVDSGSKSTEKCRSVFPMPLAVDRGAIDGFTCRNWFSCTFAEGDLATGPVNLSRGAWAKVFETDVNGTRCWLHPDLVAAQSRQRPAPTWGCRW